MIRLVKVEAMIFVPDCENQLNYEAEEIVEVEYSDDDELKTKLKNFLEQKYCKSGNKVLNLKWSFIPRL